MLTDSTRKYLCQIVGLYDKKQECHLLPFCAWFLKVFTGACKNNGKWTGSWLLLILLWNLRIFLQCALATIFAVTSLHILKPVSQGPRKGYCIVFRHALELLEATGIGLFQTMSKTARKKSKGLNTYEELKLAWRQLSTFFFFFAEKILTSNIILWK